MRTLPSRKNLAIFFFQYYIPQLAFSSKIFDLNQVKIKSGCNKKIMRHRKKKFTPGNN